MTFQNTAVCSPFHKAFNYMIARVPMFTGTSETEVIMDLMGESENLKKNLGDTVKDISSLKLEDGTLKFNFTTTEAKQKLHVFLRKEKNMIVTEEDEQLHLKWVGGPDNITNPKLTDKTEKDFHLAASAFVFAVFEVLGVETIWSTN